MVWLCITNVARLNGRCKRKSGMITGKAVKQMICGGEVLNDMEFLS